MAKIHTHYDNLKVARLAPQEVIRAAYKALSQKYHPDKNPGDEKAARIMAIVNSAYNILSDPVRRREHDEWIAAEEWEIEWLESTRSEDGRERQRSESPDSAWEPEPVIAAARPYRIARDLRWWGGMGLFFVTGCAVGVLLTSQPGLLPVALAARLAPPPEIRVETKPVPVAALAEASPETAVDSWASGPPASPEESAAAAPGVKALAVTQLVVPARVPDCGSDLYTLTAPNGQPWPVASGYVDGYAVGNSGEEMQVLVDNTANGSPVFVKVYDLDRRASVRHVYVLAHGSLAIEKLAAGKYEVRYQNIDAGGSPAECLGRKRALRQAATDPEI